MMTSISKLFRSKKVTLVFTLFVIAVSVWVARYARSSNFGLYEDDWTFIPSVIDMSFSELLDFISNYILQFQGQGRPLHHSLIRIFAFFGWKIGGLKGMYLIGYLIVTSNAFLFYLLLRRIHSHTLGFIGALAFCLYSADTTQAFLTHSLGLHPSLTFFLLATHAYLSRKYVGAYLLIFISLLIYETPYVLFLVVPLFREDWDRRRIKPLLMNGLILGVFFLSVYILRISVGEFRATTLGLSDAISKSLRHIVQGPIYNLRSYYDNAVITYWARKKDIVASILAALPIVFSLLYLTTKETLSSAPNAKANVDLSPRGADAKIPQHIDALIRSDQFRDLSKILAISVLLLIFAYPLTFTTEPDYLFGRETRNHFAGVVGNAMLLGVIWVILTEIVKNRWVQFGATLVFAVAFSVMVGFGQVVQMDYVRGWKYQQEFWTALLDLIPDVQENTAIIVDPSGMVEPIHILANTWNMPRVLERIFSFPEGWEFPPSAYKMELGWIEQLNSGSGTIRLDHPAALTSAEFIRDVDSDEMILIVTVDGKLSRQYSPIVVDGASYPLKPAAEPVLPNFPHRTFYDVLILDEDT